MSEDAARAAAALLAAGDDRAAFAALRVELGWPRGKALAAPALVAWLDVLAAIARARGAAELADVAGAAARDADSPDQLYELGYALIDAGAPEVAATVLWRCLALVGDSEEVVCELVSALETALAYPDALAVLAAQPALRERSFLVRYLHGFNAAMTGDLATARAVLPTLTGGEGEEDALRATLAAILARADRLGAAPGPRDLRGWHYVLTGSVLLHQSPYGFEEPMHGRYAWLQDSPAHVATGLARLAALVAPLGLPCVYAPPGRDHEILGHAAAARLGVPLMPWPVIGVPAPGLVVVHDLATLTREQTAQLVQRRPEQVLFAHASPWTVDAPVAPDVTTLLYQILVPPWEAGLAIDPATGAAPAGERDTRPAEVIGAELAAAPGLPAEDLAADEPERLAAVIAAAWPPAPGRRSRLWAGGPVPSSRFT